jgi:hypothetical protein
MVAPHFSDGLILMGDFAPTQVTRFSPLAWVTQGLVIYIRGSWASQWQDLQRVWQWVAASEFAAGFHHARFSDRMDWRQIGPEGIYPVLRAVEQAAGRRPFWNVSVANRAEQPDLSFEFSDVHATHGRERASFVRMRFPLDTPADALLKTTLALADIAPVWAGSAGYQFSAREDGREVAWDQIWAWARRYWAVEVVNTQAGSWDVLKGLLGVNWLTLLGGEFMRAHFNTTPLVWDSSSHVEMTHRRNALVIRAGPRPICGDLNVFEDVSPYATVSRLVEPALVRQPTGFFGMFADQGSAGCWVRRFLEPQKWMEPENA